MFGLFKKKTLHNKVLVLCGIPHDEETFRAYCMTGESDFIRSLASLYGTSHYQEIWRNYSGTADLLRKTLSQASKYGATIITDASLKDISVINDYEIIIIIAHHSDNSDEIEFQGRLVAAQMLIDAIPENTSAVIDMTSCYSAFLLQKIKAKIPKSTIIGIDIATSLPFRLFILDETLCEMCKQRDLGYKEALIETLQKIPSGPGFSDLKKLPNESVKLGSKELKSTIFAPNEAKIGDDFIVSVFIHKLEESDEVELMAKVIDEKASLQNTKSLNIRLHKGDKIEFQLTCAGSTNSDFTFDKNKKGLVWDNEMAGVEFCVSVSPKCTKSAFVGRLKIAVNKEPAGEMLFKTSIVSQYTPSYGKECTELHFIPYNAQEERSDSENELLSKLRKQQLVLKEKLSILSSSDMNYGRIQLDLDVCTRCIELIEESNVKPQNKILKVFISSTSDLKQYRQVIREQVESCAMFPDMYERWGQGNDYPRDMCCQHVLDSDIFVCLLGAKYGFIEPAWGMSMTEIEFRVAMKAGKPILIYIQEQYKEEMEKLLPEHMSLVELQKNLIDELREKRMVGFFSNEMNLALLSVAELLTLKHSLL